MLVIDMKVRPTSNEAEGDYPKDRGEEVCTKMYYFL